MAELKRCPECGGVATVIHIGLVMESTQRR